MAAPAEQREATQKIMGYELGEKLGYGAFSFARKARHIETQEEVAMKFTKYQEATNNRALEQQLKEIRTELEILTKVQHDNVLRLFQYDPRVEYVGANGESMLTYCMVLELCEGGELFDLLYYTGKFDEKLARTFFQQMVSGLEACHVLNIAHRDLKAQNVLLDKNFNVKLADFGSSNKWVNGHLLRTCRVGTKGYQAPELILKRGYTYKVDIFALGVLLFISLSRHPPFREAKVDDPWFRDIARGKWSRFWERHAKISLSDECKALLQLMLTYQPLQRATIEQIRESEWFNGEVFEQDQIQEELTRRRSEAYNARKSDPSRTYAQYDSIKGAGQGGEARRGDNDQPADLPVHLKWRTFSIGNVHPAILFNRIQTNVTEDWPYAEFEVRDEEGFISAKVQHRRVSLVTQKYNEETGETYDEEFVFGCALEIVSYKEEVYRDEDDVEYNYYLMFSRSEVQEEENDEEDNENAEQEPEPNTVLAEEAYCQFYDHVMTFVHVAFEDPGRNDAKEAAEEVEEENIEANET